MRIITFAITGALMACVAVPAMAATKKSAAALPSWATCDALAGERGIPEGTRRSSETGPSAYRQFMVSCRAGKVPLSAAEDPNIARMPKVSGSWVPTFATCDALAMERGVPEGTRRSSENGPSAYRQFMVACLAGKVEGRAPVPARIAAAPQIPGRWEYCDALAMKRGVPEGSRRSSENGPSDYRQFMVPCLAGQIR